MYKLLFLILFFSSVCFAEKDLSQFEFDGYPKFSEYLVKDIYKGENHLPVKDETSQIAFDDLAYALTQPVNFAGHYIVYTFSCGTSCLTGYIADAKTGENVVAFPHFYLLDGESDKNLSVIFKVESSLILFAGIPAESLSSYKGEYYNLQNNELLFLKDYSLNINKSTNTDQKSNGECSKLDLNKDSYLSGYICFYSNKSLLETYKNYREENLNNEEGKNLRKDIKPLKDYDDVIIKGSKEFSYKWLGSKELAIELFFAGGVTKLNFKEKANDTELKIIYDAD